MILQVGEKKGQTRLGVVYTDGKIPPPLPDPVLTWARPARVGLVGRRVRAWGMRERVRGVLSVIAGGNTYAVPEGPRQSFRCRLAASQFAR